MKRVIAKDYAVEIPLCCGAYTFVRIIGSGSFSVVLAAVETETGKPVAVKVFSKQYLVERSHVPKFEREITLFSSFDHPHIVRFIEILNDDSLIYVIMEYCDLGNLHLYFREHSASGENCARFFIHQILLAVQYLHSRRVAHRDLKPENILVQSPANVKLVDFGLSTEVSDDTLLRTQCGSPLFAAPEIISGLPYDGRRADMWSLGVIVYLLVVGKIPWDDTSNHANLYSDIQLARYRLPDNPSSAFVNFVGGLMNPLPLLRFTVEQALNHPWLANKFDSPRWFPTPKPQDGHKAVSLKPTAAPLLPTTIKAPVKIRRGEGGPVRRRIQGTDQLELRQGPIDEDRSHDDSHDSTDSLPG
jgi:serine/threonine protein kinase